VPLKTVAAFVLQTLNSLRLSRKRGAPIPQLQKDWTRETLRRFRIEVDQRGEAAAHQPLLLLGNHISYLDIPLLMNAVDDVSFVAKKELAAWPIFGRGARAINTIFVERGCASSRQNAREAIREGLRQGRRIVLFPSGTTCMNESKAWRHGVFEIAHEMGVPVQPFRLTYSPLREVAFIDDDLFFPHLYNLTRLGQIRARLEFHPPVTITDPARDSRHWQNWAQEIVASPTNAPASGAFGGAPIPVHL